jgi:hypothetical protein
MVVTLSETLAVMFAEDALCCCNATSSRFPLVTSPDRKKPIVALRAGHYLRAAKPLRLAAVHIGRAGAMMRGSNPGLECNTAGRKKSVRALFSVAVFSLLIIASTPQVSLAERGGVGFWLPGTFGSLAAVPGTPGFSFSNIVYNTNVSAGGNVSATREITIGALNPTLRPI